MSKRYLVILVLMFSAFEVLSQGNAVRHFNIRDGLPANSIRALHKDSRGYLWIGTDAGVARFDGEKFTTYSSKDGLANESVWSITEDGKGRMWFGCYGGGVTIFDGREFKSISVEDSLHTIGIRVLKYFAESNLVIAGCQDGLIRFNMDGSFTEYYSIKDSLDRPMLCGGLHQFHKDTVLFSSINRPNYFYLVQKDSIVPISDTHKYSNASCYSSIYKYGKYTCASHGISIYSEDTVEQILFKDFNLTGPAWDVAQDNIGNYWAATWGGAKYDSYGQLIKCKDGHCSDYAPILGIESEVFWSLLFDEENEQLYIGTLDQGLYVFTYSPFENVPLLEGKTNERYEYFKGADDRDLMVGERKVFELKNDSLSENIIEDCLFDAVLKKQKKWAMDQMSVRLNKSGSFKYYENLISDGLWDTRNPYLDALGNRVPNGMLYDSNAVYDPTAMQMHFSRLESKIYTSFNFIASILHQGKEWYSSDNGLIRVNGSCDYDIYKVPNGGLHVDNLDRMWIFPQYSSTVLLPNLNEPSNYITMDFKRITAPTMVSGVIENSQNRILFTSWDRGFFTYEGDTTFKQYERLNSFLTADRISRGKHLENDRAGLCLANGDLMIIEFTDTVKLLRTFNLESGLHGSTIFDIQLHDGVLFVFHEQGIDHADYEKILSGQDVRFTLIDEHEGFPIYQGKLAKRIDDYWYSYTQGYIKVDLEQLKEYNKTNTSLSITDVRIDYKSIDWQSKYGLKNWQKIPDEIVLDYDENNIEILFDVINLKNYGKDEFRFKLAGWSNDYTPWRKELKATFPGLAPGSYEFIVQSRNQLNPELINEKHLLITITPPWWETNWFLTIVIFLLLASLFMLYRWRTAKLRKRQKILTQKIREATEELLLQKQEIEEVHREITDSIAYAKRIQLAILPPQDYFEEQLPNAFVLYLPKDVVAGDFYWMQEHESKTLFAAADCTGHGVPGAMVSVICNNGLNRAVRESNLSDPGEILDKTRELVLAEFHKSSEEVKDGMDIALCSLQGTTLKYAGAHNPLWIIRKGSQEVEEIKANKQPIGKYDEPLPYTTHTVKLSDGDSFYIFSDGYADQFGGEKGKKFKAANFKRLLLSIQNESMERQKVLIDEAFDRWKGALEQLDDVCVIGVRV